jgi:mono/diheme cytochrome c family protein
MRRLLITLAAWLALGGCSRSNMDSQPKYHQYERGDLFRSGTVLQVPPEGAVARDDLSREQEARQKPKVDITLLARGREQFEIYCSPCHDRTGSGNGIVVQRGMPRPPSYHDPRLRAAPDQHFFDVITHGYGAMYSYAARVSPRDRWAIAAYIRALQLSQHASLNEVPDDERKKLDGSAAR